MKRIAPLLATGLLAVLGCREDARDPTAPESPPVLSTAAAAVLSFRQVSTGVEHTCGVTTDNRAYCWGHSAGGALGNGTANGPAECHTHPCSSKPVAVRGGLRFQHVSAGAHFTCGLTTENRVYCWGSNEVGQLGDGTQTGRLTPVALAGTRRFRQVRAGWNHACAITTTDVAFCWGSSGWGELGNGTDSGPETCVSGSSFPCSTRPVAVKGGLLWRQLSGGFTHTCGVTTTNKAYCWGRNLRGEIGDGSTIKRLKPTAVSGGILFRQIDAGFDHTCAVAVSEYRGYCWGDNEAGELGDGTRTSHRTPAPVFGSRRFDNVSAGSGHTCGVTRTGRTVCWGGNGAGQLGNGTTFRRATPTPLSVELQLRTVSAGHGFTCGATTENRGYCWGDNFYGQLGDGTVTTRLTPVAVAAPM